MSQPGSSADEAIELSLSLGEDTRDRNGHDDGYYLHWSCPDRPPAINESSRPPGTTTSRPRTWLTEPLAVTIHLAFAFDIGDEIDLDRARLILQGEPGQLPRRGGRRNRSATARRRSGCDVEPVGIRLPGDMVEPIRPPRGELTLFDFGAISLAVRFPDARRRQRNCSSWPAALAEPAPLTDAARRLLAPWLERIEPAVHDFAVSEMSEEYIVFQLGEHRAGWLDNAR